MKHRPKPMWKNHETGPGAPQRGLHALHALLGLGLLLFEPGNRSPHGFPRAAVVQWIRKLLGGLGGLGRQNLDGDI